MGYARKPDRFPSPLFLFSLGGLGARSLDNYTAAGKSSASMFCHFNSSRAIVLLQLGRTEKGKPSRAAGAWTMFHKFVTQIRDQPRVVPGARAIHTGCFERRQSSWVHANVNAANGVPWKRHLL